MAPEHEKIRCEIVDAESNDKTKGRRYFLTFPGLTQHPDILGDAWDMFRADRNLTNNDGPLTSSRVESVNGVLGIRLSTREKVQAESICEEMRQAVNRTGDRIRWLMNLKKKKNS